MKNDFLPPTTTVRWVIRRKAQVVNAVRKGTLKESEAKRMYNLSSEEFDDWKKLVDAFGVPGLRVTRIQKYRRELGFINKSHSTLATSSHLVNECRIKSS